MSPRARASGGRHSCPPRAVRCASWWSARTSAWVTSRLSCPEKLGASSRPRCAAVRRGASRPSSNPARPATCASSSATPARPSPAAGFPCRPTATPRRRRARKVRAPGGPRRSGTATPRTSSRPSSSACSTRPPKPTSASPRWRLCCAIRRATFCGAISACARTIRKIATSRARCPTARICLTTCVPTSPGSWPCPLPCVTAIAAKPTGRPGARPCCTTRWPTRRSRAAPHSSAGRASCVS